MFGRTGPREPCDRGVETLVTHLRVGVIVGAAYVGNAIDSDIEDFPSLGRLTQSKVDRNNRILRVLNLGVHGYLQCSWIGVQRLLLDPVRGPPGDRAGVGAQQPVVQDKRELAALVRSRAAPM